MANFTFFERWYHKYPGTNFHEQNIDWVIKAITEVAKEMNDFEIENQITYKGAWNISSQYKKYSIVTDNDIGYLAVQDVPAGVDLTNEQYWVIVADFTPQMADLQDRVSDLESDVDNIDNELDTVKAIAHGKDMKDHIVLFIGDSWGAGWNNEEGTVTSPETICGKLLGCTYYRKDEGGAGFAYANGHWFGKLLQDFVSEQSSEVVSSITDIIITGGQNDLGDSNDYVTGAGTYECPWVADYINTHFPTAKVWLGMVARTCGWNTDATYGNVRRTINNYVDACRLYNWHYIANSHLMVHDYRMLSTDGKHLLESGYIKLGQYLATSILNGFWRQPTEGAYTLHIQSAADTHGTLINGQVTDVNIVQWLSPEGVLITNESNKIWEITTPVNLVGNTDYTLCYYGMPGDPDNFFNVRYRMYIPINVIVVHDGAAEIVPASLRFNEGGEILLRLMATSDNGNNWKIFSNVSRIIFQPFSFNIPIDYC